jgi:hypothetical protein
MVVGFQHPSARIGPFLLRCARYLATFAFCRHNCASASRHPPRSRRRTLCVVASHASLRVAHPTRAARWMTRQRLKRVNDFIEAPLDQAVERSIAAHVGLSFFNRDRSPRLVPSNCWRSCCSCET